MDTQTHRRTRWLGVGLALVLLSGGPEMQATGTARITITGGTHRELAIATWVLTRYRDAGLELPEVEIQFHPDPSGCRNNSGYYLKLHLDVCVGDQAETYARRVLVHELAHAWSEAHLTLADRTRFLRLRDLDSWNSGADPWALRGFEQASEVLTWGIGDRTTRILLPDYDDPASIALAYEALTGLPAPAPKTC